MRSAREIETALGAMAQSAGKIRAVERVLVDVKQHADAEPVKATVALVPSKSIRLGESKR